MTIFEEMFISESQFPPQKANNGTMTYKKTLATEVAEMVQSFDSAAKTSDRAKTIIQNFNPENDHFDQLKKELNSWN